MIANYNALDIEKEILELWKKNKIYEKIYIFLSIRKWLGHLYQIPIILKKLIIKIKTHIIIRSIIWSGVIQGLEVYKKQHMDTNGKE